MIRIAVCDDEINTLEGIGHMILEYAHANPQLGITLRRFHSAYDLLECQDSREQSFHIYFLDILMPLMDGIEVGRQIRKMDDQAIIIYLTASADYALDSFKVSPFQYLVKPIDRNKLFGVLEKACTKIKLATDAKVLVRVKGGLACILYHQICFIEYMNHTMTYHLTNGKTLTTMVIRESFTDFTEKYLQDMRFIKPHASFVLNMDYVQVMTSKDFEMMGGETVPISKRAYTQVRKQFMEYMLTKNTDTVMQRAFV